MAQLMPLLLTVSCSNKIQIGFTFWYRLTWVVPDKGLLNGCVCVAITVHPLIYYYALCGLAHEVENVRWCGRRLLDGHTGSAIKVLVAIHYSVLDARNGYIRNVVV